jgi:hypothetical protein
MSRSEIVPQARPLLRRLHRVALVNNAYYMYSTAFGDGQVDDPVLGECLFALLEETHTHQTATVRSQQQDIQAVVFIPRDSRDFYYVEVNRNSIPISSRFAI